MLELLRKRRSIRKFTSENITPEQIEMICEAALRAPTSRGINPWEFVLVDDRELLAELSRSKQHGADFLKNAPLAIVVCGDSNASDVWIEDCSIAAILIQLTALSLGLGSCWAQIRCRKRAGELSAEARVQELLSLPDHIKVECIVGIGHPDEKKRPVSNDALKRNKLHKGSWS